MAIPEACGLWIEQRVQEELEARGDTGASLREIGRQVAAEVERYFETKVKPGTIYQRTRRLNEGGTNVPPKSNPQPDQPPTKPQAPPEPPPKLTNAGGKREGAGPWFAGRFAGLFAPATRGPGRSLRPATGRHLHRYLCFGGRSCCRQWDDGCGHVPENRLTWLTYCIDPTINKDIIIKVVSQYCRY